MQFHFHPFSPKNYRFCSIILIATNTKTHTYLMILEFSTPMHIGWLKTNQTIKFLLKYSIHRIKYTNMQQLLEYVIKKK